MEDEIDDHTSVGSETFDMVPSEFTELPVTSSNIEERIIKEMMDIHNPRPIMQRLSRLNVTRKTLKDITSSAAFDAELYNHCKGEILLPAMAKILHATATKAASGNIPATRTYLELMKLLNSKQEVNVNILQYQGLSDSELDRRLMAEMSRHGIDVDFEDANPTVIDAEISE